ncbi:MFS transporter [Steroidobacter sp.]|uniref:MFS transporter n=1 Tax=Steroidobacter sp. TaxID=1978227 RepID=UPI001A60318C|nr:MFS transporter [Steroidobacter sp.]MBL8270874.1 MFS transporter [Steroidobacter sp.]
MSTQNRLPHEPGMAQGLILLLPCTLSVMGIVVLIPVLPQLMASFSHVPGYQYLIQGGVLTMPALCIALFSPLAGWLADRYGRRRILIGAMVAYGVVGIAPAFLQDLYAIVATRVGVGLCEAVIMTASTTLISDYFHGHAREKWLASQTAVASLSSLALIMIGGVLGSAYGWRGPFFVYAFGSVLAIGVWLLTWEPKFNNSATQTHNVDDPETPAFPWARIAGICAITLFASVMFYTIQTQSSLALASLGVQDPARLSVFTAIASLGVPLGTFVYRAVLRWSIGLLLCIEFGIIGIGFVLMGKAPTAEMFVAAAALNQIGCGMILPTLLVWATRGLHFQIRGRGTGAWQATFAVGQFVCGLVVTWLALRLGGPLPAFVVLGVSSAIAALLAIAGHRVIRTSPPLATHTSSAGAAH